MKEKKAEKKRLARERKAQDKAYVYVPPDPEKQVVEVGERDGQFHIAYSTGVAACDNLVIHNEEYVDWIEARDRDDICVECRAEMHRSFGDNVKSAPAIIEEEKQTTVDTIEVFSETEFIFADLVDADMLKAEEQPPHRRTKYELAWERRREEGKAKGRPRPKGTR